MVVCDALKKYKKKFAKNKAQSSLVFFIFQIEKVFLKISCVMARKILSKMKSFIGALQTCLPFPLW